MAEGFGKDIQTSSSKVSQLRKALAVEGAEDADLIMMNILQIFNETDLVLMLVNFIHSSIKQRHQG